MGNSMTKSLRGEFCGANHMKLHERYEKHMGQVPLFYLVNDRYKPKYRPPASSYAGQLIRLNELTEQISVRRCAFDLPDDDLNITECKELLREFNECYSSFIKRWP